MQSTVVNEVFVLPLGSAWEMWHEDDTERHGDYWPDLVSANLDADHRP